MEQWEDFGLKLFRCINDQRVELIELMKRVYEKSGSEFGEAWSDNYKEHFKEINGLIELMFRRLENRLNIENKNLTEIVNLGNQALRFMMGETVEKGFLDIIQSLNEFLVDLTNRIRSCLCEQNLSERINNLNDISSYNHNSTMDKLEEIYSLQCTNEDSLLKISKDIQSNIISHSLQHSENIIKIIRMNHTC
jgi:hypothetical protein